MARAGASGNIAFRMRNFAVLTALCVSCLLASSLHGQASVTVSPSDPVYRDIDRLAAAGMIDTLVYGQRPFSRRQIARLITSARRNADGPRGATLTQYLRETLAALEERFADELSDGKGAPAPRLRADHLLQRLSVTYTSNSSAPRIVPPDTGIGEIDAVIDPLAESGQQGRDVRGGRTVAIETWHELTIGPHVALQANPRMEFDGDSSPANAPAFSMGTLAARLQQSNVVLSVGRDHLEWGQGRDGGIFLSSSARALDMLWIGNDQPWILPGFLRKLGPSNASFLAADLGARQYFPHTLLFAYKISSSPTPNLELGFSVFDITGGSGAPTGTLAAHLANLFLFPILPYKPFAFSNELAGLEVRYRLHRWRGAQVYWELSLDDFDPKRLWSSVWRDDAGHVFGLNLPALSADGRLALTAEVHHTGTRFDRHLQFRSGVTEDRQLLGDPLGPDADGGYLYLDWDPEKHSTASLVLAEEAYRNNQYVIVLEPFGFRSIGSAPEEHRYRATLSYALHATESGMSIQLQAGVERTTNFDFAAGAARTGAIGSLTLSYSIR